MALFFWSKIGVRIWRTGRHTPTNNSLEYPPTSLGALTYSWNKVTAWSLTSLSATSSCTNTQVACVAGVFWLFYFVVRKVRGTASHKLDQGRKRKWWFFSLRSSLARLLPDSFRFCPRFSFRAAESFTLRTVACEQQQYKRKRSPPKSTQADTRGVCACLHDILSSKTYPPAWLPRYAAIVNMADTRTRGSSRSPARGVRNRSRSRERERPREREANENKVSIDREKV